MKIDPALLVTAPPPSSSASPVSGAQFEGTLESALQSVDDKVRAAESMSVDGAKGEAELHEVALALEEADIAMRLTLKARNKVVEAYQEIMRMPV